MEIEEKENWEIEFGGLAEKLTAVHITNGTYRHHENGYVRLSPLDVQGIFGTIKFFIEKTLTSDRLSLVEKIGESHNPETDYTDPDCGLVDHSIFWDGNYFTCKFCGKEFVMKDNIISRLEV